MYFIIMSLVTAGSGRQVQATILLNNGNIQIGPKVKVSAKLYSIWPMTITNSLCISQKLISNFICTQILSLFYSKGTLKTLVYIALNRNLLNLPRSMARDPQGF